MRALHGGPALIACLQLVIGARRRELLDWLRPIEALLRRLLFLEAQELRIAPAPRRPPHPRLRHLITPDPQKPETWPAHFRAFETRTQRRPATMPTRQSSGLYNAFTLAERWEAALRVVDNPARYARRLAARLAREPALAQDFAQPPPAQISSCSWALDAAYEQILWRPPDPEPAPETHLVDSS
jgi:hypothetical protein